MERRFSSESSETGLVSAGVKATTRRRVATTTTTTPIRVKRRILSFLSKRGAAGFSTGVFAEISFK